VKLALGASRGRIVRQLLAESMFVALLAGALGSVLLVWLRSALEGVFSFTIDLSPGPAVFLATAVIAAVTGVAFGVVPALHATRASLSDTLKTGSTGLDPRRSRLLHGFVVAQLTLGLPLLLAAALFGAATRSMDRADLGFTAGRDALGVELDFRLPGYSVERADALIEALRARVSSLGAVRAVAFASGVPMFRQHWSIALRLPPDELAAAGVRAGFLPAVGVDPEYFATVGIPVLRGRGIGAEDVPGAPLVAVVGEDFARTAWPGLDPIGRTLHTTVDTTRTIVDVTVVGVARAVQQSPLGGSDYRVAYMARRQLPARSGGVLVVRTAGDAASLAPTIRAIITQLDPRLPVAALQTFEQARRATLREYVPTVAVTRAAAVLALALGCLGVYALVAFNVAQRAREIAIRMALGAHASDVTALFMKQGTRLALYGLVLGLPLGMGIRLALANLLGEVGFTVGTAAALGGVVATLLLTAAAGSWLPARRAARVDPFRLMRTE
jgi:predicted permease